MTNTLVLQSHRQPLPHPWLSTCIDSVKSWAKQHQFDYQFLGNELFAYLPDHLQELVQSQTVIASDLARLKALQHYLKKEYATVVWCDADFLIFSPNDFALQDEPFSIGREIWIQTDNNDSQKLKAYKKTHNAFMMFRQGNSFLDFYTDSAQGLLERNRGPMPPQFIGPKLLTAIHNVVGCPILETAGMLSPLVIKDIANKTGPALDLFKERSHQAICAANLCSSLYQRGDTNEKEINTCIDNLLSLRISFN